MRRRFCIFHHNVLVCGEKQPVSFRQYVIIYIYVFFFFFNAVCLKLLVMFLSKVDLAQAVHL